MYFNEDGKLSFETQGGAAVSVGYLTIGWVVKKYDLPAEEEENVAVTCVLHNEAYTDEDNVVHAFFYVSREEILEKIRRVDADWEAELRVAGGIVYLDAVMTCTWYHEVLGQLFEDGSTQGEVYWTYEGIAGARGWGYPEELHQYYDRKVVFEPEEPDCIMPAQEIYTEESRVSFRWSGTNPAPLGGASVSSDVYQAARAIPSGEFVKFEGFFSPWSYDLAYVRTTVKKYYPVKVNVITRLRWEDRKGLYHEEEVSYARWYIVEREAQMYGVKEFSLYWADKLHASAAFMNGISSNLDYSKKGKYACHFRASITEPDVQGELMIDGGVITGQNGQRPTLPIADYSDRAQQCVGALTGVSDRIEVAGQEILGKRGYVPLLAPEFATYTETVQIFPEAENGTYDVSVTADYQGEKYHWQDALLFQEEAYWGQGISAEPVFVWTPILCKGSMTGNKKENQMLYPDEEKVPLVLGCDFTVRAEYDGNHTDSPGYGYRDYSPYVAKLEAQFDFAVQRDGATIPPGTWVDIGVFGEKGTFRMPLQSREGTGIATIRATAVNGAKTVDAAYRWNDIPDFHRVYDEIPVEISGKVHAFSIIGVQGMETEEIKAAQLPCGADRLPLTMLTMTPGQRFFFEFQTAGGPYDARDIKISPRFYVYRQGRRQAVDLYKREQTGNQVAYRPCRAEDMGTLGFKEQTILGESVFWGEFLIPSNVAAVTEGFDLERYLEERLVFETDECWVKEPILVNFQIETMKNGPYLSYANEKNAASGYCCRWLYEGFRKGEKQDLGDVVFYNLKDDFKRHFPVVGTH